MSEQKQHPTHILEGNATLANLILEELDQNVFLCYQCSKCSGGCPLATYMDWLPHQILHAIQLNQETIALQAETAWLCAGCQTCSTRCPQGLDITAIMEFLTREGIRRKLTPPVSAVHAFNQAFLREVRLWGRAYELGLMAELNLRNLTITNIRDNLDLGRHMLRKGKVTLLPRRGQPPQVQSEQIVAGDDIAYYPGCSLHSTASEFDHSARAVAEHMRINFIEPEDWLCCGSSAVHRIDPQAAIELPLQNLAGMEQQGFQKVSMPCAACFNRHKTAQYEARQTRSDRYHSGIHAVDNYEGFIQVENLLDTFADRMKYMDIAALVEQPLQGLRVAPYYGCLLTRPPQVTGADNPENPISMDRILQALDIEVIAWSHKTSCCGASHTLSRPQIALDLSSNLIHAAQQAGADAIAVACPLCHMNLDAMQFRMPLENPMPVLFFTQLMALAFGLPPHSTALEKNCVDPRPILRQRCIHYATPRRETSKYEMEENSEQLRPARAPPADPEIYLRIPDALELLERIWQIMCAEFDVIGMLPALKDLFKEVDIDRSDHAAEQILINMLCEIIENVDRFSPWYNRPARAYGLVRQKNGRHMVWRLSPDSSSRWQHELTAVSSAISEDRGLIMASCLLEELSRAPQQRIRYRKLSCTCIPARTILVSPGYAAVESIICAACQQPYT